jgi:hypothetical protein
VLKLRAELLLLGDEFVYLFENVAVLVHQPSVPDYRDGRDRRQETRDRLSRRSRSR